jgi:hypothetical protein
VKGLQEFQRLCGSMPIPLHKSLPPTPLTPFQITSAHQTKLFVLQKEMHAVKSGSRIVAGLCCNMLCTSHNSSFKVLSACLSSAGFW